MPVGGSVENVNNVGYVTGDYKLEARDCHRCRVRRRNICVGVEARQPTDLVPRVRRVCDTLQYCASDACRNGLKEIHEILKEAAFSSVATARKAYRLDPTEQNSYLLNQTKMNHKYAAKYAM